MVYEIWTIIKEGVLVAPLYNSQRDWGKNPPKNLDKNRYQYKSPLGGGGFGDPETRADELIEADTKDGYVPVPGLISAHHIN